MNRTTITTLVAIVAMFSQSTIAQPNQRTHQARPGSQPYEYRETRDLVQLVDDAAKLVKQKGESAFAQFDKPDSRWRRGDFYIFVLDTKGNMLVHPDPQLQGKNQLALKDIAGKPIVRGLIETVTASSDKTQGWYHYQWPVPGEILPRWKSTYVQRVNAPNGITYVVGSGVYNDRMERTFVVDLVKDAVEQIEKNSIVAFEKFRDPKDRFMAKDAYIFVVSAQGVEIVNPAFPNLEGRNIADVKDTTGKPLVREMINTVERSGSGWVQYMWPRPGESIPTQKSAYVAKAKLGDNWVLVGCGVYLAHAPRARVAVTKMTAPEVRNLVVEASTLLQQRGEAAFAEFRQKGSKWFTNSTYIFIRDMNQNIVFHPADPTQEGRHMAGVTDVIGRPYGMMFQEAATGPTGEGWVHYMYPEPGSMFPSWKSTFVKRTTFPNGKQYIVGCGVYDMNMDESFVTDVVNRAAALIREHGKDAFSEIRDKKGPFVFMDIYVFVDDMDGKEVVCGGHPALEGRNLMNLTDANGKYVIRDCLNAVRKNETAWVDYVWYKPGENVPARKHTFVRKVHSRDGTFLVGCGYYPPGVNGLVQQSR